MQHRFDKRMNMANVLAFRRRDLLLLKQQEIKTAKERKELKE